MARAKTLSAYPQEYFMLFTMANEKPIHVKHETPAQAEATRNDLYTFRQVLYSAPGSYYEELKTAAQNVRLAVKNETLTAEPIRIKNDENTTTEPQA